MIGKKLKKKLAREKKKQNRWKSKEL